MDGYTLIPNLAERLPDGPPDSIVSQALHADGDVRAVLFRFAPGQELTEHTASQPAMLYIVSGQARLTLGSDETSGRSGTWVYMTPNLPHSVYAETDVIMLLLLVRCASGS